MQSFLTHHTHLTQSFLLLYLTLYELIMLNNHIVIDLQVQMSVADMGASLYLNKAAAQRHSRSMSEHEIFILINE